VGNSVMAETIAMDLGCWNVNSCGNNSQYSPV